MMKDPVWLSYTLDGRGLDVSQGTGIWRVRIGDRESEARHLDHALAQLLNVSSHIAVRLALAILDADPGSDISR